MTATAHYQFSSMAEALEGARLALKAGDKELVKQAFEFIACQIPPTLLVKSWTENLTYESIFELWGIFHTYGLTYASENESVRAVYDLLTEFIVYEAPPEVMAMFREGFKKFFPKAVQMIPVGYDDNGIAYYSVSQACEVIGIEEDELREGLQGSREVFKSEKDLHKVD